MRRVLVGTPCYDGRVEARYHHSMFETLKLCQGIELLELLLCYEALIQNLRNELVAEALRHKVDDLIFIDSDQDWKPEWVPKLLSYPVDCVGAPVPKKSDQEQYNVRLPEGPKSILVDEQTGLWTGPGMVVGTGFLRFSRKALQALWDASEKYEAPGKKEAAWIFDVRPVNGKLMGEDILIGEKLAKAGIQYWLDPTMTCGHTGVKRYQGDFQKYIAAML